MKQFIIFVSALFFCANINSQVYVNEDSQMGIGREPMSDYILTIQRTNSNGLYLWNRGNHDMHIFSMIPNNATYSANIIINGGNVELHPGTTIINSNVQINPAANHPSQ